MTFCCENTRKAYELMGNAKNKLDWSPEGIGVGGFIAGVITVNNSTAFKLASDLQKAGNRMVEAHNILCNARNAINACNCGNEKSFYKNRESELVDKYNSLSSSSADKYNTLIGEWNELKGKHDGLIDKFNENIADYSRLIGENKGLQDRFSDLNQRFNRLNDDNEELKEKYEEVRREWHQEELRLGRNEERLRQEGIGLREQLTDNRQQLTIMTNERNNLLIRVDERDGNIRDLNTQIAALQIESNDRNVQLRVVGEELVRTQQERDERITATELQELLFGIENRDREINSLKERLGQSKESDLTERIRNKENKLESFIHRLGINWEQIQLLRDIFNELVHSRRDGNINGVRTNQDIIATIKQSILQTHANFDDVQEICDKCEEIAQLSLQLEQQFEARIEVPINH